MYSRASGTTETGGHAVLFYDEDSYLLDELQRYIREGLAAGDTLIVVATEAHRESLVALGAEVDRERYTELDARDTLARLMVDGMPDREKFLAIVDPLCRRGARRGNGRIRIFGEMVALLWQQGRADATLRLEALWDELRSDAPYTFSLLCAYPIRSFDRQDHEGDLLKICGAHTLLRPAESPRPKIALGASEVSGSTGSTLVVLQQKTVALEREAARRAELEGLLRQREDETREELERRVTERTGELVRSQMRLRQLTHELCRAERRARNEIASELHDYLAQRLVVARLELAHARRNAGPECPGRDHLKECDDALHEAIRYTRTLMTELKPPILESGLPMGLRWLARQFHKHRIAVTTDIADDLELALSEDQVGLLFQSARELLMNVVKHARTDSARISLGLHGNELRLEVSDRGRGFDPSALRAGEATEPHLTRFGLFSIRERVEALGGRFEIEAGSNAGTRARLALPLEAAAERSAASAAPDSGAAPGDTAPAASAATEFRVLIVEDHALVREGLRTVLEEYPNIRVIAEAADGTEAVLQAERHRPDVVIMDINLPKLDGISATRSIKKTHPQTIVIALSVYQPRHVEPAVIQAGADAYVTKEFAAASLYEALQGAIGRRRKAATGRES